MELTIQSIAKELRTDSRLLAQALDHRHRTILENIDRNIDDLAQLGRVPFETGTFETKGGQQTQRFALLNEDQCYFILTLMRNNKRVVEAKLALVKAFSQARKELAARDLARADGKIRRKLETEAIQDLVNYATEKGSRHARHYYTSVTQMTNKLLGIESGSREGLDEITLRRISAVEIVVELAIRDGLRAQMEYHDIYKLAKYRASLVAPAVVDSLKLCA